MLVMALEANQDMPQMDVVTEHLLHRECKLNGYGSSSETNNAMKLIITRKCCIMTLLQKARAHQM